MNKIRFFIAHLFIAIWAYFPSIVICVILYQVFWSIAQSNDLLHSIIENETSKWLFILAGLFIFYMIWHSSEIVGINKVKRMENSKKPDTNNLPAQEEEQNQRYPSKSFFGNFSSVIAHIAYSIVISSFLRMDGYSSSTMEKGYQFLLYFLIFFTIQYSFFILLKFLNKENERNHPHNKIIRLLAIAIVIITLLYSIYLSLNQKTFSHESISIISILTLFIVHLIRKVLLINYEYKNFNVGFFNNNLTSYFGIKRKYAASFFIFNIIGISVFILYVYCVADINTVQQLGPLGFLLIALGIFLGIINMIIFFSIKAGFNLYVFIFIIAIVFGKSENHYVKMISVDKNAYPSQVVLEKHVELFLDQFKNSTDTLVPMYFVLADGGASRAGLWTASVLSYLESNVSIRSGKSFYQHLFAISSASGGSVGAATFLYFKKLQPHHSRELLPAVNDVFSHDLLSPALSYLLSFDFGRYLLPVSFTKIDRNIKLEKAYDNAMGLGDRNLPVQYLFIDSKVHSPIFAFNVTRVQDGSPAIVTNLKYDPAKFNHREDVLNLMRDDSSLTLSSAAFLSARFPYISPAGRIDAINGKAHYFVDGGYFDNSGAGFVQELINEVQKIISTTPYKNRIVYQIIHIKNAPGGAMKLKPISPIRNDFLAPLTTVMGSYGMQTNTNDYRLINYARERGYRYDAIILSDSLKFKYPMNWVLSNTVRQKMEKAMEIQTNAYVRKDSFMISRY